MQILIDGTYLGLDALTEANNLAKLGLPAPPDFALANSVTNPLGQRPAKALFILLRRDIDAFGLNSTHTAKLVEHDERGISFTLQNLTFVNARCLTPGKLADPDAAYLAEFADARWLVHNPYFSVPINKQYNVRAPAWGTSGSTLYYADSTNAGTAWTWATMIADVWGLMTQLGAAPSLPFTPDGAPEGWKFLGMPAWVALNQLLWRIGCAVKSDLVNGTFSIVRVGSSDTQDDTITALSLASAGKRIHDEEFVEGVRAEIPASCRVLFQRIQEHYGTEQTTAQTSAQFSTSQIYTVDVAGGVSGSLAGTYAIVWDDLPATYDSSGSITNAAACATRAAERAADFYRMIQSGGSRLHRTFTGLHNLVPGSTLKGVCWRQDLAGIRDPLHPGGWITEIVRHPFKFLKGMNEQGWVEEDAGSTSIQPPDLAPTYPNYPHLLQVLRIATAAPSSGRYDAYVQVHNPVANTDADGERVWAVDLAGATELGVNDKFLARLSGYYPTGTRPLYRFRSNSGTINGPVTFTSTIIVPSVTVTDSGSPPASPPSGDIIIYQIGGVTYYKTSGGVIAPIGGQAIHPWDALQAGSTFADRWHVAGQHRIPGALTTGATQSLTATWYYAAPILATRGCTIDAVAICSAATGATVKCRIGLYTSTSTPGNLYPDALVRDYGQITLPAGGGASTLSGTNTLTAAKIYWLVFQTDSTANLVFQVDTSNCVPLMGFSSALTSPPTVGWISSPAAYGALPGTFPDFATTGSFVPSNGSQQVGTNITLPALFFHCSA